MTVIGWMTTAILFRAVALELSSEEATKKNIEPKLSVSVCESAWCSSFFLVGAYILCSEVVQR